MQTISMTSEMKDVTAAWKKKNTSIALVPTMGFFHEGHLSLMQKASQLADKVVVSLFVNPIQFGENEDLDKYPRDLDRDCQLAEQQGVDILYTPDIHQVYPPGFQTSVVVKTLTRGLCGDSRPGHFDGVTTVVCKLFNLIQPDFAVFGEKDFQQLAVIRQMTRDLDLAVQVRGMPIFRETNGLAMSSRNTYLLDNERDSSLCLYRAVIYARKTVEKSSDPVDAETLKEELSNLLLDHPLVTVDYIEIVDKDTLRSSQLVDSSSRLIMAIFIDNRIRLIDNCGFFSDN